MKKNLNAVNLIFLGIIKDILIISTIFFFILFLYMYFDKYKIIKMYYI